MDDLLLMYIVQALTYFTDYRTGICLLHSMSLSQKLQKLTSSAIFYQKIDVFLVLEVPIQRGDVTMIEIELNAQLSRDLVHIFLLSNLLLRHHFHSAQKTCFFVYDKHNFSKLTLTHFLTYRKITFFELFRSLSNILRR